MDAGRAEVVSRSIDMSPILTVIGPLAKNLLRDTPFLQFRRFHLQIIEDRQYRHLEYGDPCEGYISIYLMPQLGQHDVVHHGNVCVNKATAAVYNSHVQRQGLLVFRLRRALLSGSLGRHAKGEVNVAYSPIRCRSGSLKKFLRVLPNEFFQRGHHEVKVVKRPLIKRHIYEGEGLPKLGGYFVREVGKKG